MKKIRVLFVIFIISITVILRLYKIKAPIADWHSFRQVDTASVARYFVSDGMDLLHPKYHDLSNIQSGKDNPNGWRMVEFPFYQGVAAILTRVVPSISIDVSLRLVTIASAAGTALFLTLLVIEVISPLTGIVAGLVYALLPYSVFFGRAILPETFAVFWAILSLYLTYKGAARNTRVSRQWVLVILGAISGAVALLTKPTAGFLLLPVLYLFIKNFGVSFSTLTRVSVYIVVSAVPLWWWRNWITQFPEGIPAFDWLLNKENIRFKGAWFQWLFAERIGKLILGYWGLIPLGLGIVSPTGKKEGWLFYFLGLGGLLYLTVFAAGNVQHDYYQIILLPIISIYVAKGVHELITNKSFARLPRYALFVTSIMFTLAFSWYTMRTYYWINRPEIIEAGTVADSLLPKDAKVIAPYNGDTTFLYQTRRAGWPLGFDIDEKIAMGATHYVTVSPTDADFETKELAQMYTVLVRNEKYAIIDLTKPRQ